MNGGIPSEYDLDILMLQMYHHDVRTTLTLDADVMAKLRAEARRSGRSFKEIVNTFLRLGLNALRAAKPSRPFIIKARELGLRQGLNYDNIGELLEQTEGPLHP